MATTRARKTLRRVKPIPSDPVQLQDKLPEYRKLACWQLRKLGYTVEQTAQIMELGTTTVKLYDKEVDECYAEMPSVRIAIDKMMTMVPRALGVYNRALEAPDLRIAKDAAKDILTTFKVLTDRIAVEKADALRTDEELVAEAERIIAQRREAVSEDQQ